MNTYGYVDADPINYYDPDGLAKSGQTTNLGGGTTVRIDKPHVPGQQTHAHVETPKGSAVVNQDGSQSHKSKGNMNNITNKAKKFLRGLGFKNIIKGLILNPCLLNPMSPGCSNDASQCPLPQT